LPHTATDYFPSLVVVRSHWFVALTSSSPSPTNNLTLK
jgi:hypothetical protein